MEAGQWVSPQSRSRLRLLRLVLSGSVCFTTICPTQCTLTFSFSSLADVWKSHSSVGIKDLGLALSFLNNTFYNGIKNNHLIKFITCSMSLLSCPAPLLLNCRLFLLWPRSTVSVQRDASREGTMQTLSAGRGSQIASLFMAHWGTELVCHRTQ